MTTHTPRTYVKFCGFTEAQQLATAIQLGVDAVGLVLYDQSPRGLSVEQASELAKQVPPFVSIVVLVVNMPEQELVYLSHHMPFDIVQFHGDESPHLCQLMASRVNKRWMKALRVTDTDTEQSLRDSISELKHHGACAVLLDAYHPDKFGGTGERFDWKKIPTQAALPIILAGGLTPNNVKAAIDTTGVFGVDVSGGIEFAKGQKDAAKMAEFIQAT